MRASWSRVVTAISAAAVLTAAGELPGALVGRKGERPVGIAAPPTVTDTVVQATAAPPPVVGRPPVAGAPQAQPARGSRVAAPVAASPRLVAPAPAPTPAPTPTAPAPTAPTPSPAPAPAPAPSPPSPPPSAPP